MRVQLQAERIELRLGEQRLQLLRVQTLSAQLVVVADTVVQNHRREINEHEEYRVDAEHNPGLHENRVVVSEVGVLQARFGNCDPGAENDRGDHEAADELYEQEL